MKDSFMDLSVKNKIIQLCIRALTLVEKEGFHLGEAAIDLVIDKQLTTWPLEEPNRY